MNKKNYFYNFTCTVLPARKWLAALVVTAAVGVQALPAHAEKGWFIKPEAELLFIPQEFNHGQGQLGLGGGLSLSGGYQYDAWQWEIAAGWQYRAQKNVGQTIAGVHETASLSQNFIPVYTSLNYTFPFLQSIDTTVGFGGGVVFYAVNNTYSPTSGFNDNAFVTSGLLVPKVELDYAITDNLTLIAAGKFYFMLNGYNDLYSSSAKGAVSTTPTASPLGADKTWWYGGLTVGANYRF